MASQGPNNPGTAADGGGSKIWDTPNNAKTENALTTFINIGFGGISNYLKVTNFGFTIPSGATINGIYVSIKKKQTNGMAGGDVLDSEVKIIKADGTIGASNKGLTTTSWGYTLAYVNYGGVTDLWGETWDDTKINDNDFGIAIKTNHYYDKSNSCTAYIDHIRITVYYTEGGGGGTSAIKSVNGLAKASVKSVDSLAIASVKSIDGLA